MASERRPATSNGAKKMIIAGKGKPWARQVDADLIREAEGTVDAAGIRRIEFCEDPNTPHSRAMLRSYEKLGYTIEDKGRYIELSISDARYRNEIEAKVHERGRRQVEGSAAIAGSDKGEFTDSYLTESTEKLSPEAIIGDE